MPLIHLDVFNSALKAWFWVEKLIYLFIHFFLIYFFFKKKKGNGGGNFVLLSFLLSLFNFAQGLNLKVFG